MFLWQLWLPRRHRFRNRALVIFRVRDRYDQQPEKTLGKRSLNRSKEVPAELKSLWQCHAANFDILHGSIFHQEESQGLRDESGFQISTNAGDFVVPTFHQSFQL